MNFDSPISKSFNPLASLVEAPEVESWVSLAGGLKVGLHINP